VTIRRQQDKYQQKCFIRYRAAIASKCFNGTLEAMRHLPTVTLCLLFVFLLPAAERPTEAQERWYRADADITLFGITIFSRGNVGGGFARITETSAEPGPDVRLLFVSGSLPERAHGLNRMGYIEESVSPGEHGRAEYLGFMTASGEESLADAKKALHGPAGGAVEFVASRGEIDQTSAHNTVRHLPLPSSARWTDAPRLKEAVEEDLAQPGSGGGYADLSHGQRPGTFLYTVLTMVRSPARVTDGSFVHNGKLFRLHAVKRADAKAGAQFAEARLMSAAGDAIEMAGLIRNAKTGAETTFHVWFDRSSPNSLPLRFEFQPKSYLKLVFEAQPAPDPTMDPAMVKAFAEPMSHAPAAASAALRTAFRQ
jgi:hypothetical protein